MKPRLRLTRSFGPGIGWWECVGDGRTCVDSTPSKAYYYWRTGTSAGSGTYLMPQDPSTTPKPWWKFWA